jgi:hypothetical protein
MRYGIGVDKPQDALSQGLAHETKGKRGFGMKKPKQAAYAKVQDK